MILCKGFFRCAEDVDTHEPFSNHPDTYIIRNEQFI